VRMSDSHPNGEGALGSMKQSKSTTSLSRYAGGSSSVSSASAADLPPPAIRLKFTDMSEYFDRVCKVVERGFKLSHAVLKHLKQVARLEGEYARAMMSSSRDDSKLFQMSNGTVGFAWLLMFNSSVSCAQQRATFAQELKEDVCSVLSSALDMLSAEFKRAESEGMKCFEAQQRKESGRDMRSSGGRSRSTSMETLGKRQNGDETPEKRASVISNTLVTIRSVEIRRIDATNKAITAFETLAKKLNVVDANRFSQLHSAIESVNVDEDEASLCSKIIAECSSVPASSPSISLTSASSECGGSVSSPAIVVTSDSSVAGSPVCSSAPERPRARRTTSTLNKIIHTLRGDSESKESKRRASSAKPKDLVPNGVVGVPFEQFMNNQKELYPNLDVPVWCVILKDSLTRFNAQSSEGLFRVSSGQHAIEMYKEMLSSPLTFKSATCEGSHSYFRLVRSVTTVPVLASLFKFLFRDAAVPVIPQPFYEKFINNEFIDSMNESNFKEIVLDAIQPACHRNIFIFVIGYLRSLGAHSDVTKMGLDNLSMIFAPCLLRCPSDNPASLLQFYELEQRFVRKSMKLLSDELYTSLNTTVPCFPDGKPYNGKGCELVKDDPLCAKHRIVIHDVDSSDEEDMVDETIVGSASVGKSKPPCASPSCSPTPESSQAPSASSSSSSSMRSSSSEKNKSLRSSGEGKKLDPTYVAKLSKLQKRAEREISCLTESFDHIRSALLDSSVNLKLVKDLSSVAETTMLSLQSFAWKNLNCTDEALLHLQDEPSFKPFKPLTLHPDALEKEPKLFDTAGGLSESLANMHVVLSFVRNALESSTSVSLTCKIGEAAKVAKTSFVIPVSSLLQEEVPAEAKEKEHEEGTEAAPKAAASDSKEADLQSSKRSSRNSSRSSHGHQRRPAESKKEEIAVRHKSKRMSLSSPDLVYMARLRAFTMRLDEAMADCDKLIESVEKGTTKRDVLVSFIQQVRPFLTLERQLFQFTQEQKIKLPETTPPKGDADSILMKIQLVKFHLNQNMVYLDSIVEYIVSAPKPFPKALSSSIDSLISTAEALFDS